MMGKKLLMVFLCLVPMFMGSYASGQNLNYTEISKTTLTEGLGDAVAADDYYWEPLSHASVIQALPQCGTGTRFVMGQLNGNASSVAGESGSTASVSHNARIKKRDYIADWVRSTTTTTYQIQNIPADKDIWVKGVYDILHFNHYAGPNTQGFANGGFDTNLNFSGTVTDDGVIEATTPDGPSDQAFYEAWTKLEGTGPIVVTTTANASVSSEPATLALSNVNGWAIVGVTFTIVQVVAVPTGAGHP